MKRRTWPPRRNARRVDPQDRRSPLHRLLMQQHREYPGEIYVAYDQQWRTYFKAERQGFIDEAGRITEKGKQWLAEQEDK